MLSRWRKVGWYQFFFLAGSLTLFWALLLYGESHAVTLLVLAILGGVTSLVGNVLIGLHSFSANGSRSTKYESVSLCLSIPLLAFCLWDFKHHSQYISFICALILAVVVGGSCVVIATLRALRRSRSTMDPGASSGTNRDPSFRSG
jgi:hypothetical protein